MIPLETQPLDRVGCTLCMRRHWGTLLICIRNRLPYFFIRVIVIEYNKTNRNSNYLCDYISIVGYTVDSQLEGQEPPECILNC